jgi:hypothetical protein
MKSILYVSKSDLGSGDGQQEVERIVIGARGRNSANGITGMLVFTGDHFAQLLEGPAQSVDLIISSIRLDSRHHSLVEFTQLIEKRAFGAWSLGYEGRSTYVDRLVRSLLGRRDPGLSEAQAELQELMLLLAHQSVSPSPAFD